MDRGADISLQIIKARCPCIRLRPYLPISERKKIIEGSKLVVITSSGEKPLPYENDTWLFARNLVYALYSEIQAEVIGKILFESVRSAHVAQVQYFDGFRTLTNKNSAWGGVYVDSEAERLIREACPGSDLLDRIKHSAGA
jgi:hypothetical protein